MTNIPVRGSLVFCALFLLCTPIFAQGAPQSAAPLAKESSDEEKEDRLPWWPTEARPAPVPDEERGGYWWWPSEQGKAGELWGNRGYAYVNKIIYDWREGKYKNVNVRLDGVSVVETRPRPSLLIKRRVKEFSLTFANDNTGITRREAAVLSKVLASLKLNPTASVLIGGEAGSEAEALLVASRATVVEKYLINEGLDQARVKSVPAGKFREAGLSSKRGEAPGAVRVIVAEVEEVVIPGEVNRQERCGPG